MTTDDFSLSLVEELNSETGYWKQRTAMLIHHKMNVSLKQAWWYLRTAIHRFKCLNGHKPEMPEAKKIDLQPGQWVSEFYGANRIYCSFD